MNKSFAANALVAQKLICKGFERYSRQSFGPNIGYLRCSGALFSIDDSVLNELLNEADTRDNLLAAPKPSKYMLCAEVTQPELS